jgi:hypothetical protein
MSRLTFRAESGQIILTSQHRMVGIWDAHNDVAQRFSRLSIPGPSNPIATGDCGMIHLNMVERSCPSDPIRLSFLLSRARPAMLAILFFLLVPFDLASYGDGPVTIDGFQALLFNSKTGTFSRDILGKDPPELGNVPAGEFASVSTFVVVRVRMGKNAPAPKDVRVRLVATQSGSLPFVAKGVSGRDRVILDQTEPLGPVNPDGVTHVGFWLARTGCGSVALNATIIGVPGAKPLGNVLPFTCYE